MKHTSGANQLCMWFPRDPLTGNGTDQMAS